MITGAHAILYSTDAEADRVFLRDLLGRPSVDAGGGWLIMALPPAEIAVHGNPRVRTGNPVVRERRNRVELEFEQRVAAVKSTFAGISKLNSPVW